jgi:hypothetical protein
MMNTQETNDLQESLNELSAQSVEQTETPQKQSVEIHVTGFTLFAETM